MGDSIKAWHEQEQQKRFDAIRAEGDPPMLCEQCAVVTNHQFIGWNGEIRVYECTRCRSHKLGDC